MLYEHIWEEDFDSLSNVVTVYINHLRKKIHKNSSKKLIHSIHGIGYIIKD